MNKQNIFKLISFTFIIILCINIYKTYQTKLIEPDLFEELKAIATKKYIETSLNHAIENKNYDDIESYQNLAILLNINLESETIDKINNESNFFNKSWENTKKFSESFITGESDSTVGLAGSITSDMFIIGDIRDIKNEATKYLNNEDFDEFTLGLASVGLALSASEIITVGSTTSIKIGASLIKFAKKSGKISKSFLNIINSKITKSVDFSVLKNIDYSSISKLQDNSSILRKSINMNILTDFFEKINKIKNNTSSIDSIELIKYIENEKELDKMVKISEKFGKNTKSVFKVLGKGALKTGKFIIEFSTLLIFQLILLLVSILGFIFSLFTQTFILKRFLFKKS